MLLFFLVAVSVLNCNHKIVLARKNICKFSLFLIMSQSGGRMSNTAEKQSMAEEEKLYRGQDKPEAASEM
jgi:hypothetical protein